MQALLDSGADDNHVGPDFFKDGDLSSWLNAQSHDKNTEKSYLGENDSFEGWE